MRVLSVVHHRNAAAGVFADGRAAELVEWLPHEAPPPALDGFDAAMIFGADAQVDQEDSVPWLRPEKQLVRDLLERGTPMLGVCFGSQLLAEAAGAEVRPSARPEIGWHEVELTADGQERPVARLPARAASRACSTTTTSGCCRPAPSRSPAARVCLQAFRLPDRPVWGVQFHPEVTEADFGEWLDGWEDDAGAVATGLDPDAIRAETAAKIGAWNAVGRELSARFLARLLRREVGAGQAAVHQERRGVHEARLVAGEEQRPRRDLARLGEAAGRQVDEPALRPSPGPWRTAPGAAAC